MNQRFRLTLSTLALIALAGTAHAGDWRVNVTPYLWGTDLGVNTKINDQQVVDQTIPVSDLINDINTIFQMKLEVTKGEFGVMADAFYVTMATDKTGVALPQGAGSADLYSDIGMTIVDVAALYDPKGDHGGLQLYGGTRILNETATIDAAFQPTGSSSVYKTYDTSETLVDALAGVRFGMRLSRHFGTQMQADVSTGDTDYTWSAGPTVVYAFGRMNRHGVNLGYRKMVVDFQDESGVDNKMTLSGPSLGFRTSF